MNLTLEVTACYRKRFRIWLRSRGPQFHAINRIYADAFTAVTLIPSIEICVIRFCLHRSDNERNERSGSTLSRECFDEI
jgi:hypothetical protein